MKKVRIFISFAAPFNLDERNALYKESLNADSGFTVSGWSVRSHLPRDEWEHETTQEIERADSVVALIRGHAAATGNVADEIEIARALGKRVFTVNVGGEPDQPTGPADVHSLDGLARMLRDAGAGD